MRRSSLRAALAALIAVALPGVAWAGILQADPARPGATGFFSVSCKYSHRLPDDPIVAPGRPGASHLHDFFGNRGTNAASTLESLRAREGLCRRPADRSAYWVPTLLQFDAAVTPRNANVYYRTARRDPSTIAAFPAGLRVIAGDARATGLQPRGVVRWSCVEAGPRDQVADLEARAERRRTAIARRRSWIARHRRAVRRLRRAMRSRPATTRRRMRRSIRRRHRAIHRHRRANRRDGHNLRGSPGVPRCPAGSMLKLTIEFPDCWNGTSLDSPDHRSHLAYAVRLRGGGRVCPPSHRVAVPRLVLNVRYPTRGGPSLRLASGEPYTAHADFFNAWESAALEELVRRCLRADVHCGGR